MAAYLPGITDGNGSYQVNGFKVGIFESTLTVDCIDVSQLLTAAGYFPASVDGYAAKLINGVPTLDTGDTIGNYLSTAQVGASTEININLHGTWTTLVTPTTPRLTWLRCWPTTRS